MRYIVLKLWLVQIPRIVPIAQATTRTCVGRGGSIEMVVELQAIQISMEVGDQWSVQYHSRLSAPK